MAVPKKKRSYTRRHLRRAHHALKKASPANCSNCGEPTIPHRVCPNCQFYKGKRVLEIED